jgi:hypothetical protein
VSPDIPEPTISREDVPARLWEDPFAAVRRSLDQRRELASVDGGNKDKRVHTPENLEKYLEELLGPAGEKSNLKLTVLVAMVPGGPYAENREFRRRVRYAVLSGLSGSGFTPNDELHVGFWQHPKTDADPALDIPFEAHIRDDGVVLVLWLADESLLANPLQRLNNIFRSVAGEKVVCRPNQDGINVGQLTKEGCVSLRLVGPWRSGTLQAMVADACDKADKTLQNLEGLAIYAASPTVPDKALLPTGCDNNYQLPKKYFENHKIDLFRTIPSDQAAADLLGKELQLRGIDPGCQKEKKWPHIPCSPDPGGQKHYVVLLAESDTLFGRKLGEALRKEKENSKTENAGKGSTDNILSYRYFRGIDGVVPGTVTNPDSSQKNSGELSSIVPTGNLEPAEGPGQFDYLRRLADELKEKDQALRRQGKGRILAFGVLGSDFYDKLLVLQALRERFPNHIYFTTDLDARFLEPKRYRWTRNLIVASGYGLDVPEAGLGMGEVPRFRSHYQTSYFLAVRSALSASGNEGIKFCPKPRIFETGRSRFVELSNPSRTEHPDSCGNASFKLPAPQQTTSSEMRASGSPFWRPAWVMWFSVIAFLGSLLALFAVPQARRTLLHLRPVRFCVVYMAVRLEWKRAWLRNLLPVLLLFVLLMVVIWGVVGILYVLSQTDEPLVMVVGVSLWPSDLIRLAAGLLSLWLIFLGFRRIRADDEELQNEFYLEQSPYVDRRGVKALFETLFTFLDWLAYAYVAASGSNDRATNGRKVWSKYLEFATPRQRVLRIVITGSLFYSIGFIMLYGFDNQPLLPYRGEFAFWASTIVDLFILGLPFTFLLFGALDEILLSSCLIHHLTRAPTRWNESREAYRSKFPEISDEALDSWITVRFLAARTEMTASVMNYPFMILLLILFSLSTTFDNWDTTASVAGILGFCFLLTGYAMVVLRHAARKGKENILEQIEDQLVTHRIQAASSDKERLALLVERIRHLQRGAFRHWYQEPVIKALLWVLGVASLLITQYIRIGV